MTLEARVIADATGYPPCRCEPAPSFPNLALGSMSRVRLYFEDEAFDGQLQRSIGKADSGMASVGECLTIAAQITPGDRESWYREWSAFGWRLKQQADAALDGGHAVSARAAYLRAAEYFRQAFFFHRDDRHGPELQAAYPASVQAFQAALPLLGHAAVVLSGAQSGYLFAPAGPVRPGSVPPRAPARSAPGPGARGSPGRR